MAKLLYLVVLVTALELCSTRPAKNNAQSKKTKSACMVGGGKKMPTFKSIALYDNITLSCPKNLQSVTFAKNCKLITVQQNNTKFMISGNSLNLTRFVVTDSGKYTCKGTSPNGTMEELTWVLHIMLKKNTGKTAEYKEKAIDSAVVLDCRSFADKRLFYSHSKTEQSTEISHYLRVVRNGNIGLYELFQLKLDDTGFYYCGQSNLLMHLVVRDGPYVSGKALVKAGEDVVLTCKYTGSEAFAWYKGSKKMVGIGKVTGQLMNIHKTRHLNLTLPNVTSNSIGKYGCSVVIENTTLTTTINVDVLEFDSRNGVYGDYNTPNATIFLHCLSNQGDKAKYSLLTKPILSSEPFKVVKMGHGITELVPGIYQIDSLSPSEEGYYKCRASLKGVTIEKQLDDVVWMSPS